MEDKAYKDRALLLEKTLVKYYKSRNLSYNITDEAKKKISEAGKRPCTEQTKRKSVIERFSKAVLQSDSNDNIINRFSSASEAERHLNGKGSHISCCCLGKRKTAWI